jgi:hypothetical protein
LFTKVDKEMIMIWQETITNEFNGTTLEATSYPREKEPVVLFFEEHPIAVIPPIVHMIEMALCWCNKTARHTPPTL